MSSRFSEEYLRLLKAISDVAIVAYTDSRGRITFANQNFCNISGYSLEELYNQDHRILNSGLHPKDFFTNLYKTIHDGKVWRGEVRNKKKNGQFYWVDTQIIPIIDSENKVECFASVRFDITARKNLELSLINMEKLASLGEMSAVVAHEINNPLAIIDLSIDSLLSDLEHSNPDLEKIKQKISKLGSASKRISKIVRGLKTFSRTSKKDEWGSVNLKNFIEELLSFSKIASSSHDVIFKCAEIPDIKFECHPDEISQVLINLINNAHDAVITQEEKWIELSIKLDTHLDSLIFKITDSGLGIAEDISEKMFSPFYTTKAVGEGTGLGLSIAKKIIDAHNGELYLDQKSKHTCFIVRIPIQHFQSIRAS